MWASLFRTWSMGDWMRLAELAWKPYRIGEYEREASGEDKAALLEALDALTTNGFALIPKTTALQMKYPEGLATAGDQHGALCAFLAAEQSKCVLGATLTVEQGRVGSNALGNVHADVSKAIRDADAHAIEATIRRQLITPLVRMNFGDGVAIPSFQFLTDDAVDYVAYATALDKLANRGLRIPARWARTKFGIPEPEEGEEVMGGGSTLPEPAPQLEPAESPEDDPSSNDERPLELARHRLEDAGWICVRRSPEQWSHHRRRVLGVPRSLALAIQDDLRQLSRAA
jgi:phage gp29-like protein